MKLKSIAGLCGAFVLGAAGMSLFTGAAQAAKSSDRAPYVWLGVVGTQARDYQLARAIELLKAPR